MEHSNTLILFGILLGVFIMLKKNISGDKEESSNELDQLDAPLTDYFSPDLDGVGLAVDLHVIDVISAKAPFSFFGVGISPF